MPDKPKIGFIGLGSLGEPIAENLLERGHSLLVFNRSAEKTRTLVNRGAVAKEQIADLARESDIIFSMVSDDAALQSVADGPQGLLAGMRPGSIHICMSTILPQTAARMEALHRSRNTHYLAAPVFGRPEAARARKLHFAISGEESIRRQAGPCLQDAGGAGIWDFGDSVDAANKVKLCGNFMIAAAIEAMGESISLARQSGVDVKTMWDMFTRTLFSAPLYANYGRIILESAFEPAAFTAKLGLKDMNLVLEQAAAVKQPMPLAALLQEHLSTLVDSGRESLDWSAVFLAAQKG